MKARTIIKGDVLALLLVVPLAVGLLLQMTTRDSSRMMAGIFYALPLPLIAGGLLLVLFWCLLRKFWGRAVVVVLFACFSFTLWISRNRPADDRKAGESSPMVTLATWNAAGTEHPILPLVKWLPDSDVDVLALVESSPLSDEGGKAYLSQLPGWKLIQMQGGKLVFCRGDIDKDEKGAFMKLPNRSSLNTLKVRPTLAAGAEIKLLVADIGPNPFESRKGVLKTVFLQAGEEPSTVVLGDFNTPVESVHFNTWRHRFLHGATEGNIAYRETWPWFLPALCIDHIWLSKDFVVSSASRKNFKCSDHSMVIVHAAIHNFSPGGGAKLWKVESVAEDSVTLIEGETKERRILQK